MRPLEDDQLDRQEVEAQQCAELTCTNGPKLLSPFMCDAGKTALSRRCVRAGRNRKRVFGDEAVVTTSRVAMLVARAAGVHPVNIPNPVVKPASTDGTALETVWESRSPPTPFLLSFPSALTTSECSTPRQPAGCFFDSPLTYITPIFDKVNINEF